MVGSLVTDTRYLLHEFHVMGLIIFLRLIGTTDPLKYGFSIHTLRRT